MVDRWLASQSWPRSIGTAAPSRAAARHGVADHRLGFRLYERHGAIRHNPMLRSFCLRLGEASKAAKVALLACMRELLAMLNVFLK